MLKAIEEKLANLKKRSLEINDLLIQQDIASDIQKFTKLNKELSDILPIVETYDAMNELTVQKDEAKSLFCLLYTSPSPRDQRGSRMPSSA